MSTSAARNITLALVLGLVSSASAQTAAPATASAAVEDFMHAIRDSNLTQMANLFGNSKGSVARTNAPDYAKKLVIMQAMLGHIQSRALGEVPNGHSDQRSVTTEIAKGSCKVVISVTAVQYKAGWLVHDFPLEEASSVNKPCAQKGGSGN